MASLLEGQLAKQIFAGFKGKLLKGILSRTVPGGGLDEFGDPTTSITQTFGFEGFTETFSLYYRREYGIPDTDVSIMIFTESIKTTPVVEDRVTLRGITYQLRKLIDIDPTMATYRFAGYVS